MWRCEQGEENKRGWNVKYWQEEEGKCPWGRWTAVSTEKTLNAASLDGFSLDGFSLTQRQWDLWGQLYHDQGLHEKVYPGLVGRRVARKENGNPVGRRLLSLSKTHQGAFPDVSPRHLRCAQKSGNTRYFEKSEEKKLIHTQTVFIYIKILKT